MGGQLPYLGSRIAKEENHGDLRDERQLTIRAMALPLFATALVAGPGVSRNAALPYNVAGLIPICIRPFNQSCRKVASGLLSGKGQSGLQIAATTEALYSTPASPSRIL